VPDVEFLRISYGISDSGDEIPNQYVDASAITTDTDWENVFSVKIEMVVRSSSPILPQPQDYEFQGTTVTPTDTYYRRTYSNVIFLRNRGAS